MVKDVVHTKDVVKDVDAFFKRITEIQMISQLVMNENIKDLNSINLFGKMPIKGMIEQSARSQLDTGIAGNYMDPIQLSRYMNMIKVACLDFKQSNV